MKLIGFRRALIIGILLALNVLMASAYFLWIRPMHETTVRQLQSVESAVRSTRAKIMNIKQELADYEKNIPVYRELEEKGFFRGHDAFDIQKYVGDVASRASVKTFNFERDPVAIIKNADAEAVNLSLTNTRIRISNVEALLDMDFFRLLDRFLADYPTHIRLDSFELSKKEPLSGVLLQRIANRDVRSLIDARAVFDWYTLLPAGEASVPVVPRGRR